MLPVVTRFLETIFIDHLSVSNICIVQNHILTILVLFFLFIYILYSHLFKNNIFIFFVNTDGKCLALVKYCHIFHNYTFAVFVILHLSIKKYFTPDIFFVITGQFKEILNRWFKKNIEMKKPASNQTLLVSLFHTEYWQNNYFIFLKNKINYFSSGHCQLVLNPLWNN
jgi:hypothetical protein